MRKYVIGVMGGSDAASELAVEWAYELGAEIARRNWVLLTGGRSVGVMDAASRGAKEAGGLVIGVIPGGDSEDVSDAVDVAIVTGMGSARNNINVLSSDVVISCGETSAGTLSEIALAVKAKKPVVMLSNDAEARAFLERTGAGLVHLASDPQNALAVAATLIG